MGGYLGAVVGTAAGGARGSANCADDDPPEFLCGLEEIEFGLLVGAGVGAGVGTAAGTYAAGAFGDHRGSFFAAMVGAFVGEAVVISAYSATDNWAAIYVALPAIPVGAVLGYQISMPDKVDCLGNGRSCIMPAGLKWRVRVKEIVADPKLIARCGLYCGACKAYLKGRCAACAENTKAGWCPVRTCCGEHNYASCADCTEFPDPMQCKKFNSFMSKIFSFLFRSDRAACIGQIKALGLQGYAEDMAATKRQAIKR